MITSLLTTENELVSIKRLGVWHLGAFKFEESQLESIESGLFEIQCRPLSTFRPPLGKGSVEYPVPTSPTDHG